MMPFTSESFQNHLTTQILPFWMNQMVDHERGGFYGRIDGEGTLHPDHPKAIILNTRILWTFSASYHKLQSEAYFTSAKRAYDYILKHFIDTSHGGVFWEVDCEGQVSNAKKQTYAQAFAIYGLSEYYRATENQEALDLACSIYQILETHTYDREQGGYLEAFAQDWEPIQDVRLSEKDLNATKTMNTHLHVLEAYTNLYRVWPDASLGDRLISLADLMCDRFIRTDGHFNLFFDNDWNLLSSEVSYGHDIEGSWLIHEAVTIADSDKVDKYKSQIIKLLEASLRGIDEDGSLMNEGQNGVVTDTDKHWWPQAEAMVGLVNAWQLTGDEHWKMKGEKIWEFIQSKLLDSQTGEWFWRVNRSGEVNFSEDLAGPWKCPYHNGRAMLELMERLSE